MSIKGLIGGVTPDGSNTLDTYKIPTKFGLIVNRYKELRTSKLGQPTPDSEIFSMSKPVKVDNKF